MKAFSKVTVSGGRVRSPPTQIVPFVYTSRFWKKKPHEKNAADRWRRPFPSWRSPERLRQLTIRVNGNVRFDKIAPFPVVSSDDAP